MKNRDIILCIVILALATLAVGCSPKINPPVLTGQTSVAKAQQGVADARISLKQAQKDVGAGKEAHILHAATTLDVVQDVLTDASKEIAAQGKKYYDLFRDYDSFGAKWGGWRFWQVIWGIGIAWAVAGLGAVILGVGLFPAGFGLSRQIFQLLPFSNPFAWLRDRINASRGSNAVVPVPMKAVIPKAKK